MRKARRPCVASSACSRWQRSALRQQMKPARLDSKPVLANTASSAATWSAIHSCRRVFVKIDPLIRQLTLYSDLI